MPRVLLIEFVTPGRFHGGWSFPFVKGLLSEDAVPVRWLRFSVDPQARFRRGEEGTELDDADLDTLGKALSEPAATHVLFSRMPGPRLLREVERRTGGVRVAVLDHTIDPGGRPLHLPLSVEAVRRWGGEGEETSGGAAGSEPDLLAFSSPDYGYEPANDGARESGEMVHILCGSSCAHRRSLTHDDFFKDRIPAGCPERWGCSFCTVPGIDTQADWSPETAMHMLRRQLRAVARSHPRAGEAIAYRVIGRRITDDPPRFARTVLDEVVSPSRFLLDFRADLLVRWADGLREAATLFDDTGHRLEVCLVGVESFSLAQLERYGKGYPPETNLRAIRLLREIEAEFPRSFGFRDYGGLSTILYDPWTTLAEIAVNLAVVDLFSLWELCGKLLTSRLRLQKGTPIEVAARQDGLVIDRYSDPLFDTARLNFYEDEVPWRFSDAGVEQSVRLLIRLAPELQFDDDPLCDRIRRWEIEEPASTIDRARRIVEIAAQQEESLDAGRLLELAATRRSGAGAESNRSPPPDLSPDTGPDRRVFERTLDIIAYEKGLKPVLKFEETADEQRLQARLLELAARWPGHAIRPRRPAWSGDRGVEIYLGRNRDRVKEAVDVAENFEVETEPRAARDAIVRTGDLLGYPPCCARAYADAPWVFRNRNEWLWLRRRLDSTGPVPEAIHPLLSWVPCSLSCERTAELASATVADASADSLLRLTKLPTVVMLDRPGEFIFLRPLDPPGRRFRYEVAAWRTADPRLPQLGRGDTLAVEPGVLRVLARGREIAFFALDAFLWWNDGVFDPAFWEECVRHFESRTVSAVGGDGVAHGSDRMEVDRHPGCPPQELRRILKEALVGSLRELSSHPAEPLRGFVLSDVFEHATDTGWGELSGTLRRGEQRLSFYIQASTAVPAAFHRTERFALMYDRNTPPDTEEKKGVLTRVLRAFEQRVEPDTIEIPD